MKNYILVLTMLISTQLFSQDTKEFFSKADTFFKENVTKGKVSYKTIHEDQQCLNDLLSMAKSIKVSEKNAETYQAFWINVYNIAVIKGIIDVYPTNSPLDNKGFFDKTTYEIAGKKVNLNTIENKLLRAKFNDPRFHFVLVCGAIGCPPLISQAYMPNTLDSQLETQTKLALNGSFIKVNSKKKRVEGSEILKWYKEDFTMNGKTEIDFINKYRKEKIPSNYKLSYYTYNWSLNEQ